MRRWDNPAHLVRAAPAVWQCVQQAAAGVPLHAHHPLAAGGRHHLTCIRQPPPVNIPRHPVTVLSTVWLVLLPQVLTGVQAPDEEHLEVGARVVPRGVGEPPLVLRQLHVGHHHVCGGVHAKCVVRSCCYVMQMACRLGGCV
jgi:hypothetical protein